ncbi:MAG TPA: biopolymer transporter ExbD [Steroidobacteraceae bacterium]
MQRILITLSLLAGLAACSSDDPPPPREVSQLSISIDANNDCTLEKTRIECRQVAAVIRTRYPTSKPRVDICLDKRARYEAAVEVMNSVGAAGFPVGDFKCTEG